MSEPVRITVDELPLLAHMEEDDIKVPSPSRPRSKPGPSTKLNLVARNREAQRRSRERRVQHVAHLEETVISQRKRIAELEANLAQPICSTCAAERFRVSQLEDRVRELEEKLALARLSQSNHQTPTPVAKFEFDTSTATPSIPTQAGDQQFQAFSLMDAIASMSSRESMMNWKSPLMMPQPHATEATASSETDDTDANDEWADVAPQYTTARKTPFERYGPVQLEPMRTLMKEIPSIAKSETCKHLVDEMLEMFVGTSFFVDKPTIKKHLVALIAIRFRILDQCTLLDRQQFIALQDEFVCVNHKHRHNMFKIFRDKRYHKPSTINAPLPYNADNPRVRPFRDALLSIPCFQNPEAFALIDEACSLYWSFTFKGDHEDKLLRLVLVSNKLEKMCTTTEDRIRFTMSTEIGRESNKNHMDDLVSTTFQNMQIQ